MVKSCTCSFFSSLIHTSHKNTKAISLHVFTTRRLDVFPNYYLLITKFILPHSKSHTSTGFPRNTGIKILFVIISHMPLKTNKLISPLSIVCNPSTHAQTACRIGQKLDQTFFIQKQFVNATGWQKFFVHQLQLEKHCKEKYRWACLPSESLQNAKLSKKSGKLSLPDPDWETEIWFLNFREVPKSHPSFVLNCKTLKKKILWVTSPC